MKVPHKITDEAIIRARELRKNLTEAEKELWEILRGKRFGSIKFYRQRPMYYTINDKFHFYIADFLCDELKLILEIDGGYHLETKEQDGLRDEILEGLGYRTIRLTNHQILHDKDNSLKIIDEAIMKLKDKKQ
ncbi:MAG: DUF559 domain-containing protein [Ignavibacteria bacterium]|nr:DUF559 domain-containing protein [Ignavibacteria bacterium]